MKEAQNSQVKEKRDIKFLKFFSCEINCSPLPELLRLSKIKFCMFLHLRSACSKDEVAVARMQVVVAWGGRVGGRHNRMELFLYFFFHIN